MRAAAFMAGGPPLVLASASPVRRRLLEAAGVCFDVRPATLEEEHRRAFLARDSGADGGADGSADDGQTRGLALARFLARAKAQEVSCARPDAWIIGADQVLVHQGRVCAKPATCAAARRRLESLRGSTHCLLGAVVLMRSGVCWAHDSCARLTMCDFSDAFLDRYLEAAGAQVLQTVGGYALEGLGGQLFARVEGDYFAILGLPLLPLLAALRHHGVLAP